MSTQKRTKGEHFCSIQDVAKLLGLICLGIITGLFLLKPLSVQAMALQDITGGTMGSWDAISALWHVQTGLALQVVALL